MISRYGQKREFHKFRSYSRRCKIYFTSETKTIEFARDLALKAETLNNRTVVDNINKWLARLSKLKNHKLALTQNKSD